jgi:Dolichyl-phosphate-mannose-protein mannosyltransferase
MKSSRFLSHSSKGAKSGASHFNLFAAAITLGGFLARLWAASGTFLNPDEALHFRLANQPSLALAYRESLTASHPPLLTVVLYYWRALGTSELWLRMPLILAGVAFCWMFHKWLAEAAGEVAGLVGLVFVAFLPPIVILSAEIRQYALLLAFLAGALYFLDSAFARQSVGRMAAFAACLYLAMLSHYSAFWFAAALGVYAVFRIFTERLRRGVVAAWVVGQFGGLALAVVLYKTHISKLGMGYANPVLQGWMSDQFLSRSYFHPGQNPVVFLLGHGFGVFQYFFGQLAVGDVMGLVFVGDVVLLLGEKDGRENFGARRLALLLVLPFAIACVVSLAHLYPYGGTRHVAFLIIPAVAGVSVAIAWLTGRRWMRGVAIAAAIVLACVIFGKTQQPRMERADQSTANMTAAMEFIAKNVNAPDIIFTDYQSDLVLGHYLCEQRPISFDAAPESFEEFRCEGRRVVSDDYKTWSFRAEAFPGDWQRLVQEYGLKPGTTVWVSQAGWDASISEELRGGFAEFGGIDVHSFGRNIKTFALTVGQPMPAAGTKILPSEDDRDLRR